MMIALSLACVLPSFAEERPMHFDEYNHDNFWLHPPHVVICTSQTHFSISDVEMALNRWKREVSQITTRKKCDYELERGKIKIVDGALLDSDQWGYTSYLYVTHEQNGKEVRQYKAAVVQLDSGVQDSELLMHELGHAFGYGHYDASFDVMNAFTTYY